MSKNIVAVEICYSVPHVNPNRHSGVVLTAKRTFLCAYSACGEELFRPWLVCSLCTTAGRRSGHVIAAGRISEGDEPGKTAQCGAAAAENSWHFSTLINDYLPHPRHVLGTESGC